MSSSVFLILSILFLMIIAVFSYVIAKKINFPYTLFLVLVGTSLVFVSKIPLFSFLRDFSLTPELLFYVFLPTLLFEASYNIKINRLIQNIKSISLLAVAALFISTVIIGFGLTFILSLFSVHIPIVVSLLFGAIISATDPVAVIALFKEYGAPKKLTLIFEGESLFNDGTAVAIFIILLAVITDNSGVIELSTITGGLMIFLIMLISGGIFGVFMGLVFSKALDYARSEHLQITLTLVVAHLTFLLSELISHYITISGYHVHVSAIISTVIASIVMGNYGRHKLSQRVDKYMNDFWHYFAFVSNSLVFLLLGFMFTKVDFRVEDIILPIIISIFVVIVARAVGVYSSLYVLKNTKSEVPMKWQHLLAWGSLRGALAITMVLMIPDDLTMPGWEHSLSIKEFLMILTISAIYFALFVKGLTIASLIKKLNISKLEEIEKLEYWMGRAYIQSGVLRELDQIRKKGQIIDEVYNKNYKEIKSKYEESKIKVQKISDTHKDDLSTSLKYFTIGIEKKVLKYIYLHEEITELGYKKFLNKLDAQKRLIVDGDHNKKSFDDIKDDDILQKFLFWMGKTFLRKQKSMTINDKYLYYRTLLIASTEVVSQVSEILGDKEKNIILDQNEAKKTIDNYKKFHKNIKEKIEELVKNNPELIKSRFEVIDREIIRVKRDIATDLRDKNFITERIENFLSKECGKDCEDFLR